MEPFARYTKRFGKSRLKFGFTPCRSELHGWTEDQKAAVLALKPLETYARPGSNSVIMREVDRIPESIRELKVEETEHECETCEGRGTVEHSEDCWNYASEMHYTIESRVDCEECNGTGEVTVRCECGETATHGLIHSDGFISELCSECMLKFSDEFSDEDVTPDH